MINDLLISSICGIHLARNILSSIFFTGSSIVSYLTMKLIRGNERKISKNIFLIRSSICEILAIEPNDIIIKPSDEELAICDQN